jgi:hypothetical protein
MGIATKFILSSALLITLFFLGLSLIAKILVSKNILATSKQEVKGYKFWLVAMIPAFGYLIINLPVFFNLMSDFGSKLPVTSLFPFLICELFIPVFIAFLVNLFIPVSSSISRAIMFSMPVFLTHIYNVSRRWLVPLINDLQSVQNPNRVITFNFVTMEMQIGIALLLAVVFISWYISTTMSSLKPKTA